MYKDTDSLFYEIKTGDVNKDLVKFKDIVDFSSYPSGHFLFDESNRKVPLKLSDELSGCILSEAVFLKSKAYSIAYSDGENPKTKQSAKGPLFTMIVSNQCCLTEKVFELI